MDVKSLPLVSAEDRGLRRAGASRSIIKFDQKVYGSLAASTLPDC